MDLTTLAMVFFVAAGAFGLDAVWHPRDVVLEVSATAQVEKTSLDVGLARAIVEDELVRVNATRTLVAKPLLRWANQGGVAVALADAVKIQGLAYAIQSEFGYQPDRYRISMFIEDAHVKALVSGTSQRTSASFSQVVVQEQDEPLVDFVRRATLTGLSYIDPYISALFLMEQRPATAEYIVNYVIPRLPDTPVSPRRALFENLQGILALLQKDPTAAYTAFAKATASDPDSAPATLNLAFANIQLDRYDAAAAEMRALVQAHPPTNKVLLGNAYLTWAAAQLGLKDVDGAETLVTNAAAAYPQSSSIFDLWADIRHLKGDAAGEERLRLKARENNVYFENYAEIASLYFKLAWKDNQPLIRSPYANPDQVSLH